MKRIATLVFAFIAAYGVAVAGPVLEKVLTEYALGELSDVAVATTRCKIDVPESHFQAMVALNRKGWTDNADANLAIMQAYKDGTNAFDKMSEPEQKEKCARIASLYRDFEVNEAQRKLGGAYGAYGIIIDPTKRQLGDK